MLSWTGFLLNLFGDDFLAKACKGSLGMVPQGDDFSRPRYPRICPQWIAE